MASIVRGGKIPVGRWLGVPVALHPSWLAIFILVWIALGALFYPENFPDWSPPATWGAGLVVTLLFFGTVLGHELAHALVARRRGVPVRGITLSFLGGAAEIERDAPRPLDELLISAAGPLTSLGFAAAFYAVALAGSAAGESFPGGIVIPVSAGYLATINLWLAAFNSIPGFPLDGGRVLRALIWGATGNFLTATRAATSIGRVVAGLFILYGGLQFLRGRPSDLWYVFIGLFLNNAALQSYQHAALQAQLRRIPVARLMHTDFTWVHADTPLPVLWRDYFAHRNGPGLPVIAGGRFVGLVTRGDLRRAPLDGWASTPAYQVMTPAATLLTVEAGDSAEQLLHLLQGREIQQAPVLDAGRLIGLVTQADLLAVLQPRA